MEYFFRFRSRLHLHAQKGFIPLGGSTVFVRTDVLREAGGRDPNCLTEDCDLGVRLSSAGKKVVVACDSGMVTREETPDSNGTDDPLRLDPSRAGLACGEADLRRRQAPGNSVRARSTMASSWSWCAPFQ
jgi:cellulose synthase/poly-beta-1,6-N-acetylglucosamine synthase-like glycosyltransferase